MTELFRAWLQLTTWIIKVTFKVSQAIATQVANAMGTYHRGRGARRGVLSPGDPAPPPSAGGSYHDYRGVLALRTVPAALERAAFPLGRYVHPARGPRQPIGLPPEVINHNVALIGPAGSGKTTGLIVPWIIAGLRAGYSVVTIDVKGDLLGRVKAALSGAPRVGLRAMTLDYTRPATSFRWSWLAELDDDRAIDQAVTSILGRAAPQGTDPFFYHLDSQLLRGLLELVSVSPRRGSITAAQLLKIVKDQNRLEQTLKRYPASPANTRLSDLPGLGPADYAKRVTGVAVKLDALAKPSVVAVTNRLDLRLADILDSQHFVSIVAPLQDGQMAQMLSSLFVNQLLHRAYDRFTRPGGAPLLLVLDEAAQIADRIDYENVLSVARAAGVAMVIAVQDARQFKDENQRSVVFANCGTLICLSGVSRKSAEAMSERVGEHPVQTASVSMGSSTASAGRSTSHTVNTQMAPILGVREIMAPPFGPYAGTVHARDISDRPFLIDLQQ
ncbi:TraM recognition domain-containing protein [Nonomuraea sp. PA05]|uniref:type IV secretory system conjugative DNA transfer family protein n=1 Tax=Nonomuraea sp. PA05 TaxID=2604466 RepID=UPI0011D98974|nr:type IV secretory system conjugative DNA transfer family protein [Nonomuraea sp. PA05]TYB54743.1 TraM recognition domain-containing protein [Nonomuraea sp. PA05]